MANEVTSIYYRDLALGKNQQLGGEKVKNTEVNLTDGLSKAELEKIDEDKDGYVTEEEFKKALGSKANEMQNLWSKYMGAYQTGRAEKALEKAEGQFGDVIDLLAGEQISSDVKLNLQKAMLEHFETKGNIKNIDDWVNKFVEDYNNGKKDVDKIDEDTTDKLIQVLKDIAYNSTLSKVDIGKISTTMAVLSGLEEYDIDEFVINDVIEAVQKTTNIEKQLKNIKNLGLDLSYSDDDLKTILNSNNTDKDNKMSNAEGGITGVNTLNKSIEGIERANEILSNTFKNISGIFDVYSGKILTGEVKEALIKAIIVEKNIKDVPQFVEKFVKQYNLGEEEGKSVNNIVNNLARDINGSRIVFSEVAYNILSSSDKNNITSKKIEEIVEVIMNTDSHEGANEILNLGLDTSYSKEDIVHFINIANERYFNSYINSLRNSVLHEQFVNNAVLHAENDFGAMLGLFNVSISLDTAKELEKELLDMLDKGEKSLDEINNWIDDFAIKNNLDKTTVKNLKTAFKTIAYNKTLSMDDIGKTVRSYAVLSGNENVTAKDFKSVRKILEKEYISTQLKDIKALGLSTSFSDSELRTILNTGNTNGNNKFETNENYDLGKISLTKSIDNGSINGVNGKLDEITAQGGSGDCWLVAGINALNATPKGREIIERSIIPNTDGSVTVNFEGAGKSYTITKEEILAHDTDDNTSDIYSNGDNDMLALEIAVGKLRKDLRYSAGPNNDYIFGGSSEEAFSYFTKLPVLAVSEKRLNELLEQALTNKNIAIDFALHSFSNKDNIKLTDGTNYWYTGRAHAFSIKKIEEDEVHGKTVTFVNPWDSNREYTATWEEFQKLPFNDISMVDFDWELPTNNITEKQVLEFKEKAQKSFGNILDLYGFNEISDDKAIKIKLLQAIIENSQKAIEEGEDNYGDIDMCEFIENFAIENNLTPEQEDKISEFLVNFDEGGNIVEEFAYDLINYTILLASGIDEKDITIEMLDDLPEALPYYRGTPEKIVQQSLYDNKFPFIDNENFNASDAIQILKLFTNENNMVTINGNKDKNALDTLQAVIDNME